MIGPASPTPFYPPSLDELYSKLKAAPNSMEILSICSLLDCKIKDLPKYVFTDDAERNQYGVDIYSILNEARNWYMSTKMKERETKDNIFKGWRLPLDDSFEYKTISKKNRIKNSIDFLH
ncbi:hypothetical protein TNIN_338971 [Trichonephila inaurata madagascariensis]|uniref:Uncharacterized protein n=1 Tax=Trichonephila inaurata madagascariensis TaxID=2747483 RepID=A0A8X6MF90_9ARAC|nr:hypothetical protein TNIN_338971 [Trichonephila inaurata madagascariensis]